MSKDSVNINFTGLPFLELMQTWEEAGEKFPSAWTVALAQELWPKTAAIPITVKRGEYPSRAMTLTIERLRAILFSLEAAQMVAEGLERQFDTVEEVFNKLEQADTEREQREQAKAMAKKLEDELDKIAASQGLAFV